jgi:hypothetical protein
MAWRPSLPLFNNLDRFLKEEVMHPNKEIKYLRKDHVIVNAETHKVVFEGTDRHNQPSINAAKRKSRKLQVNDPFCLKVVEKLPKTEE